MSCLFSQGTESIRRDQCPMTMKLQEKSLRLLFETRNLSEVKSYLCRQWEKIHQGNDLISVKDFIFCKDVKLGHYRGHLPPGAEVSRQAMLLDPMARPPYRWRVPYVIVCGTSSSRLMDLAVSPLEVLRRGNALRLNIAYYINKCINPALDRVLGLCGVDIKSWYETVQKKKLRIRHVTYALQDRDLASSSRRNVMTGTSHQSLKQTSLDVFVSRADCECCGGESVGAICKRCVEIDAALAYMVLHDKFLPVLQRDRKLTLICQGCVKQQSSQ